VDREGKLLGKLRQSFYHSFHSSKKEWGLGAGEEGRGKREVSDG